jgi:hypothetical protein
MKKTKSCAGCRALIHYQTGGFRCYLSKQIVETETEVLDRRLDAYVRHAPVEDCKVKTVKEMVKKSLLG